MNEIFMSDLKQFLDKWKDVLFEPAKIKTPEIGETINVADMDWIILDKLEQGYLALAAEDIWTTEFGSNNDWRESQVRKDLNTKFLKKIEDAVGELPEFERNLLSLDGQTEYGTCMDKISLISVDEYRKYRKYIPNTDDDWWWTLTSDSTKCNNDTKWIRVVSPSGGIGRSGCDYFNGARPFCIFPFSIFES